MENNQQIKPCPHCGGVSYLYANYSRKIGGYFVFVKCDICGAQGKIYSSKRDPDADGWENEACVNAIAAWNMRTGADNMSFERWEQFVKETLQRLEAEKAQDSKEAGKAAGSETGGVKNDRTGKGNAQGV